MLVPELCDCLLLFIYLEASALVREFPDPVEHDVDDLLADGVVTACVVVGGVLFTSNKLFWMKELPVRACAHLIWKNGYEVHQDNRSNKLIKI